MSGSGKGGNSSTSGSQARTTPYNTRNSGKGGSYTSLNNPNDPYDGYEKKVINSEKIFLFFDIRKVGKRKEFFTKIR